MRLESKASSALWPGRCNPQMLFAGEKGRALDDEESGREGRVGKVRCPAGRSRATSVHPPTFVKKKSLPTVTSPSLAALRAPGTEASTRRSPLPPHRFFPFWSQISLDGARLQPHGDSAFGHKGGGSISRPSSVPGQSTSRGPLGTVGLPRFRGEESQRPQGRDMGMCSS